MVKWTEILSHLSSSFFFFSVLRIKSRAVKKYSTPEPDPQPLGFWGRVSLCRRGWLEIHNPSPQLPKCWGYSAVHWGYRAVHFTHPGQVLIIFFAPCFPSAKQALYHRATSPAVFVLLLCCSSSVVASYLQTDSLVILAFQLLSDTMSRLPTVKKCTHRDRKQTWEEYCVSIHTRRFGYCSYHAWSLPVHENVLKIENQI